MKALGICFNASSISVVGLEKIEDDVTEVESRVFHHNGNIRENLINVLQGVNYSTYDRICITGEKKEGFADLTSVSKPEAIEYAIQYLAPDKSKYNAVVSTGEKTITLYALDKDGRIVDVFDGNKCASGSGSFFVEQLKRMDITPDDLKPEYPSEDMYEIKGRCSVFCKTECTHALSNGVDKDRIISGLCKMTASKIAGLPPSYREKHIILTGRLSMIRPIIAHLEKLVDSVIIPPNNECFEAYGAAVYALEHETQVFPEYEKLIVPPQSSFKTHKPLTAYRHLVEFKDMTYTKAQDGDVCVLGVDIGSTTTKAVLIRNDDNSILAGTYIRTMGDPITAVKQCYHDIHKQLNGVSITIIGLGTTGSGRRLAALHAQTDAVYNEIVCHAAAALHFDHDVDTIFEIGGQDAKYIAITDGIPSDFTMNDVCSAGTGSFLEETLKESLHIDLKHIEDMAFRAENPLNFNDQCTAFISDDINTAMLEQSTHDDVTAGLIYAVCANYNSRIRGARPYGKKIFMQGGVCYNKALPTAMAALLHAKIIVPPDPGLMGALGCALETKKHLDNTIPVKQNFDLPTLYKRKMEYEKTFICYGGTEQCKRKCTIIMVKTAGQTIPFGGACDKYYSIKPDTDEDTTHNDLIALREKMLFHDYAMYSGRMEENAKTIGISRTFLTNMLYPLYFNFWDQLGFRVIVSTKVTPEGKGRTTGTFCYPTEIAHGAFDNLLNKECDYIFMPRVTNIPVCDDTETNKTCLCIQGEAYYIKQAFKDRDIPPLLDPVIDFQQDIELIKTEFVKCAVSIGTDRVQAGHAFDFAMEIMNDYFKKAWEIGSKTLDELEKDPTRFAMVIQGRSYNALAPEANMSIPQKIANRGVMVIPFDFIPYTYRDTGIDMRRGIGKITLQVAKFVKYHPRLFSTYITNFSCGPDSYLLHHVRDIMGKKPLLTLELDGHTADVGINTRIDAAIDIITYYQSLTIEQKDKPDDFRPAELFKMNKEFYLRDSNGEEMSLKDGRITFLYPSVGRFLTEGGVAALQGGGYNAKMVAYPDSKSQEIGKAECNCKECLPYILCASSMLEYIRNEKKPDEKVIYFIIGDPSSCCTKQFNVGLKKIITRYKIKDVAVYTLQSTECFAGAGLKTLLNLWRSLCMADVLEQIYSAILTLAKDRDKALALFEVEWQKIVRNLKGEEECSLYERLKRVVKALNTIELEKSIADADRITITGEMYVRSEPQSRHHIEHTLADMGFISKITPNLDRYYYLDHIYSHNLGEHKKPLMKRLYRLLKHKKTTGIERKIKRIFSRCSLYEYNTRNIDKVLKTSEPLVDNKLIGDVGISVGSGLRDILNDSCGIINIGPFTCLQTRMSEAILKNNMNVESKFAVNNESVFGKKSHNLEPDMPLPYLTIEADGNTYPRQITNRLEVFALQAKRIGNIMRRIKGGKA